MCINLIALGNVQCMALFPFPLYSLCAQCQN